MFYLKNACELNKQTTATCNNRDESFWKKKKASNRTYEMILFI